MHRLAAVLVAVSLLAACGGGSTRAEAKPTPGSFADGGVVAPYYGEELYDGRIYLFSTKHAHEKFKTSHQADPLNSKTYVRRGPHRETVVVQTDKDQPEIADRLWSTFRARYHLA